jgi:hypothetical protein
MAVSTVSMIVSTAMTQVSRRIVLVNPSIAAVWRSVSQRRSSSR